MTSGQVSIQCKSTATVDGEKSLNSKVINRLYAANHFYNEFGWCHSKPGSIAMTATAIAGGDAGDVKLAF